MTPELVASLGAPEPLAAIGQIVDEANAADRRQVDELAVIGALRKSFEPSLAAAIMQQAQLRLKARDKLGLVQADLLLLDESLQQASRAEPAEERAVRLLDEGVREIVDAGAGIGFDTMTYARHGLKVTAIERDPVVAEVLRHNVRDLDVEVIEGDALAHLPRSGTVYFDPARRADGRRIFDPEQCLPPLSVLVAAHEAGLQVVAKMSPTLKPTQVPVGWDADWVSVRTSQGRSLVEATIWSPPIGHGRRRAVFPAPRGTFAMTADPDGPPAEPEVGPLGRFLLDPHGAINQAGLLGQLARETGFWALEPQIAYLTGDRDADTWFGHTYQVIKSLPYSRRALMRAVASYEASDVVVKKRGVSVDPAVLRSDLLPKLRARRKDAEQLVVVLYPQAGQTRVVLARPVVP